MTTRGCSSKTYYSNYATQCCCNTPESNSRNSKFIAFKKQASTDKFLGMAPRRQVTKISGSRRQACFELTFGISIP